jgi:hypothetical protein
MNELNEDRLKKLLQKALPPVEGEPEPERDLWPAVLKRLDANAAPVPWFDWALFAGLVALVASFPASIPLFLYYF